MKHAIIFSFILFAILSGCSNTNSAANEPLFEKKMEDHSKGYVYPDSGVFYKYNVNTVTETISSPLDTLTMLLHKGVNIKNGWYRRYLPGCSPPGAVYVTKTVYTVVFIIQLSKENALLIEHGFSKMEEPPLPITCGYNVTRFHLK